MEFIRFIRSDHKLRLLGQRPWGATDAGAGGLVWRAALGGAVAVLGVVEALERASAVGELGAAAEALLAEEALVEGVVEVLDRAVAPRLARRHPEAAPQRPQRADHAVVGAVVDDLDARPVRDHVDLVESMEAQPTVEVARPTRSICTTSPGRSAIGAG